MKLPVGIPVEANTPPLEALFFMVTPDEVARIISEVHGTDVLSMRGATNAVRDFLVKSRHLEAREKCQILTRFHVNGNPHPFTDMVKILSGPPNAAVAMMALGEAMPGCFLESVSVWAWDGPPAIDP